MQSSEWLLVCKQRRLFYCVKKNMVCAITVCLSCLCVCVCVFVTPLPHHPEEPDPSAQPDPKCIRVNDAVPLKKACVIIQD